MSNDESINASSGKDSLYEEPEYDSDGNIVERGEEPESSVLEEDDSVVPDDHDSVNPDDHDSVVPDDQ